MPRPRFTLRALFVVMTLLCVWSAYSINWIRQRREAIAESGAVEIGNDPNSNQTAPGLLFLFGERGYDTLGIGVDPMEHYTRLQSLFPEARVAVVPYDAWPLQRPRPRNSVVPEEDDDPSVLRGLPQLPIAGP